MMLGAALELNILLRAALRLFLIVAITFCENLRFCIEVVQNLIVMPKFACKSARACEENAS